MAEPCDLAAADVQLASSSGAAPTENEQAGPLDLVPDFAPIGPRELVFLPDRLTHVSLCSLTRSSVEDELLALQLLQQLARDLLDFECLRLRRA